MLIPKENICECYRKIMKKSLNGGTTVVILVSYEVDSLCAAHILSDLLKSESVYHKIIPVNGFSDLAVQIENLSKQKELRSIIFINNGATIDMSKKWFANPETKMKAYIFDYHRPIHHNNINTSSKNIILIDDGMCNISDVPFDEEFLDINNNNSDSDDEDNLNEEEVEQEQDEEEEKLEIRDEENNNSNNDELEGEEENKQNKGIRLRGNEEIKEVDEEQDEDDIGNRQMKSNQDGEDDLDILEVGKRRKLKALEEKKQRKRMKKERIQKRREYYRGDYFGLSMAGIIYKLAQQLEKVKIDYLWYWIIGITDQLIHNRISKSKYEDIISECQAEVFKLCGEDILSQQQEKEIEGNNYKLETVNTHIGTIIPETEFMLMRYWTLYDSMFFSNYLASKLGIWKEKGVQELNKFIAKIGVPLDEAKQEYRYMSNNIKRKLKDKIIELVDSKEESKNLHSDDLLFRSFIRQLDAKTQISASDLVYCISAILENPKTLESYSIMPLESSSSSTNGIISSSSSQNNELNTSINTNNKYEQQRVSNFWAAYEALNGKNIELIKEGINIAIDIQKATVNQAIFLITKKTVKPCSDFRYSIINADTIDQQYFHHPLTLQKLAILMVEIFKEHSKNKDMKPFMLCVHNSKSESYMVVGVIGHIDSFQSDQLQKNEFGRKFSLASSNRRIRIKHDNFESSIIEIHKADFETFLDEITEQR